MKKHILIASIVGALGFAPMAVMAESPTSPGASDQMKGPPNANGAQKDPNGASSEKNANAPSSSGDNGAASAKATGEDKK